MKSRQRQNVQPKACKGGILSQNPPIGIITLVIETHCSNAAESFAHSLNGESAAMIAYLNGSPALSFSDKSGAVVKGHLMPIFGLFQTMQRSCSGA